MRKLTKQEREFLDNPEEARRKYRETMQKIAELEAAMREDPAISKALDRLIEKAREREEQF